MSYVDYGGRLGSAPGPLKCRGTTLHGFFLDADYDKLRELCQELFDKPSGREVKAEPALPTVLITFGEIDEISAGGKFERYGTVNERQVAVWIPIRVTWCEGGKTRREWGVAIPYMWLDNPISIASGREVYGYQKTFGWATFPGEPRRGGPEAIHPGSDRFELDSYAIGRFGQGERPSRRRLLTVTPDRGGPHRTAGSLRRLTRLVAKDHLDGEVAAELYRDLLPGPIPRLAVRLRRLWKRFVPLRLRRLLGNLRLPLGWLLLLAGLIPGVPDGRGQVVNQFFLRQFRSPTSETGASSAQIVMAPAEVTSRPRAWLERHHRVQISHLDSDPLVTDLGIEPGTRTHGEFRVEFDFDVALGKEIWRRD